jgi:hypothetical protein
MLDVACSTPVMVFRVLDRDGQPIGQVIEPKTAPIVGRGARTVLLVRGTLGGELGREQLLRAG